MTDSTYTAESDGLVSGFGTETESGIHLIPRKPVASSNPGVSTPAIAESLLSASEHELENDSESDSSHQGEPQYLEDAGKSRGFSRLLEWWWEMVACIVSITGCVLLIAIAVFLNGKQEIHWEFYGIIQPNTVLAIISTISRTAMMVPVASCLSQLKWRHFQRRPHRLSHLDLIDRSSRGPWGSFQVLLRLGRANVIISILAVVTILSLATGPSVQQIIQIDWRDVPFTGGYATMAYATNYTSKAFHKNQTKKLPPTHQFNFLSALTRGVVDPVQPELGCRLDRCKWPEFTILGFCALQEDLTGSTTRTCGPIWSRVNLEQSPKSQANDETWAVNCTYNLPAHSYDFSVVDDSISKSLEIDWIFQNLTNAQTATSTTSIRDPQYLKTNAYHGMARCRTSVEGKEQGKLLKAMPAVVVDILATVARSDSDSAGPPNVSVRRALFYYCAQTSFHSYYNTASMPKVVTEDSMTEPMELIDIDHDRGMEIHQVPSNKKVLGLHASSASSVLEVLRVFFSSVSADVAFEEDHNTSALQDGAKESPFTLEKTLGPWVWHTGVDHTIQNVVETVSSLIRNKRLGDNMDSHMLEGILWVGDNFFIVRWAWMSVIMLETLCVTVLLAMTIVISWEDGLVKESNFALLVHGLEGWDNLIVSRPETSSSLEKMAKGMTAKLEAGDDGVLKFRRHGGQEDLDHEK